MTIRFKLLIILILMAVASMCFAQDSEIKTLFNPSGHRASGGYGAISNKFTTINGEFANMVEIYGGWYINHKFLLGVSGAAVTNNIPVPMEFSAIPGVNMSYEYGQCGLMMEYVFWSNRAVHFAIQSFNGAGFTVQYQRHSWDDDHNDFDDDDYPRDANWFFVTEPGIKLEMNVFRWLRFSPGVSYRTIFNSETAGLTDDNLSGTSVNLTLKFGKF